MSHEKFTWTRRRCVLATASAAGASGLAGCGETDTDDGADAGGDGSGEPDEEGDGAPAETDEVEETTETAAAVVGELVEGEGMEMVVRAVERTRQIGEFQEADSGNTFVVLRMAIKNTSDGFADFSSHFQATVQNPDGVAYEASFNVTDHPLQSGLLASGEVTRGDLVFEVPEDDTELTLVMDLSSFDLFSFSRVEVDLTEEADAIDDVEQSLDVEVDSLGETTTHGDVSVTLHDVRRETELGEFTQAEEGHEYVIPDIEVENGTDEELRVSTLLQMALKTETGLSYSVSVDSGQLDQQFSEQQPIAPGQNRRGELAYEVEEDSGQLFWAFNFLEFTNKTKAFWELD